MRVNYREMQELLTITYKAEDRNIKSLTDVERSALVSMSKAFKKGDRFIDIKDQEISFESLKLNLTKKIKEPPPSPLIVKIIKFFMNVFHLRISSKELKDEVRNTVPLIDGEKQQAIAEYKKKIPHIIEEAKALMASSELKNMLLVKSSGQFRNDYTRPGFQLKIKDAFKGEFGGMKFDEKTNPLDYFEAHQEAFNQLFSPQEKDWKQFAEEMVTQTPVNGLIIPLLNKILITDEGGLKSIEIGNRKIPLLFDLKEAKKNIFLEIKRNKEHKIYALEITIDVTTPLQIGGTSSMIPIDTLGFFESTMKFTLTLDKGMRDLKDLQYDHVFKEEKKESPGLVLKF